MTGHRQSWYLDRLRAELERVAAIEDRRERSPALGRLRPALGRAALLALVALLVAAFVLPPLGRAMGSSVLRYDRSQTAALRDTAARHTRGRSA